MLAGTVAARKAYGGDYLLVGKEEELKQVAKERGIDLSPFELLHADSVLTMEDDPMSVMRTKADSSMAVALRALRDGQGDALVSCGNTGALFSGATLLVRRIQGVHRAAIGTVLPFEKPTLLMDAGANVVVKPEHLTQFAVMGTAYMKALYGLQSPRVALLNNGAEACKGTPLQTEAYRRLSDCPGIRFCGNVEAFDLPFGACDVCVTDGFSGNVCLKAYEGLGKYMMKGLKGVFTATPMTKLAYLGVKKQLRAFVSSVDSNKQGGSPILGLNKPVIKAHGSSGAAAFQSAIGQTIRLCQSGALSGLEEAMAALAASGGEGCGATEA
jgi:glycerol-3-phosphate acyltransferase PlsX